MIGIAPVDIQGLEAMASIFDAAAGQRSLADLELVRAGDHLRTGGQDINTISGALVGLTALEVCHYAATIYGGRMERFVVMRERDASVDN